MESASEGKVSCALMARNRQRSTETHSQTQTPFITQILCIHNFSTKNTDSSIHDLSGRAFEEVYVVTLMDHVCVTFKSMCFLIRFSWAWTKALISQPLLHFIRNPFNIDSVKGHSLRMQSNRQLAKAEPLKTFQVKKKSGQEKITHSSTGVVTFGMVNTHQC